MSGGRSTCPILPLRSNSIVSRSPPSTASWIAPAKISDLDAGSAPKKLSPDEWRKKYVSDFAAAVKLDSQQITTLNGILDRTREDFDKLNEKIKPERDALNEKRDALNDKWRPDREAIQNHQ